jgi:hypothetical protein
MIELAECAQALCSCCSRQTSPHQEHSDIPLSPNLAHLPQDGACCVDDACVLHVAALLHCQPPTHLTQAETTEVERGERGGTCVSTPTSTSLMMRGNTQGGGVAATIFLIKLYTCAVCASCTMLCISPCDTGTSRHRRDAGTAQALPVCNVSCTAGQLSFAIQLASQYKQPPPPARAGSPCPVGMSLTWRQCLPLHPPAAAALVSAAHCLSSPAGDPTATCEAGRERGGGGGGHSSITG